MPSRSIRSRSLTWGLGLLLAFLPSVLQGQAPPAGGGDASMPEGIQVPKPPFSEGIFPCTSCHDGKSMKVNPTPRPLTAMHDDIVLKHGPASRWCLDCHDAADRDKLHLVSGEKIDFTVSYRLCGQCHGDKYRDWRVGVHGKRTGSWNGQKQYLLCVNCHNPHSPHFKPLKPMPAPVPPERIQAWKGGAR
ncbi:MAG TPA: cytochrome c3 family protein [Holophagaceae bacterium]